MIGEPHLAPDGRHVLTAKPSEIDSSNGIYLWSIEGDALVRRFQHKPSGYALYEFERWLSPELAVLQKCTHAEGGLCSSEQLMQFPVQLRMRQGRWELREQPDPSTVVCQ